MHSRIYQIEDFFEYDMKEYEYSIEEVREVNDCADYFGVSDSHREDDLEWLDHDLPKGMFEREGDKLTYKTFPKSYIEEKFNAIKEMAESLTFDDFLNENERLLKLREALNEKNSAILVTRFDHSTQSLDGWCLLIARRCKIGQTFRIGTIFDYHY
ncbi:hypothetical protein [Prevotella disiens]|uniref:Uncharacterized protein n=1 Tax=Prevotella disiens DNF00882 TaxID=1401075 RepID=A0A096AUA9_9BACT|nr:hypothetical protein [Prevotella disiens]KGF50335.1 hypothetical protein HMPREF0654_01235 [Prevotella disiens DNF00882]